MLHVRGRPSEVPAVMAVFGFEAYGGRLTGQTRLVHMPWAHIDINGGLVEHTLRRTNHPLGRFHPLWLQELDGPLGGEMSTLLVRRAEFQGGNQLAGAFKLRLGEHAGMAPIAAVHRTRLQERAERSIHGRGGDPIQLGHGRHLGGTCGACAREAIQSLPQV
jgi:hypothetical protein